VGGHSGVTIVPLLSQTKEAKGIVVPTFVKSPLFEKEGVEFFFSNVELGVSPRFLFWPWI
jgi:hypothetical protein